MVLFGYGYLKQDTHLLFQRFFRYLIVILGMILLYKMLKTML